MAKKIATIAARCQGVSGKLTARPPDAFSLWREMVDNTFDLGAAVVDYQGRLFKAATYPGS